MLSRAPGEDADGADLRPGRTYMIPTTRSPKSRTLSSVAIAKSEPASARANGGHPWQKRCDFAEPVGVILISPIVSSAGSQPGSNVSGVDRSSGGCERSSSAGGFGRGVGTAHAIHQIDRASAKKASIRSSSLPMAADMAPCSHGDRPDRERVSARMALVSAARDLPSVHVIGFVVANKSELDRVPTSPGAVRVPGMGQAP